MVCQVTDSIYIDDDKLAIYSKYNVNKRGECNNCFTKYYCAGICAQ